MARTFRFCFPRFSSRNRRKSHKNVPTKERLDEELDAIASGRAIVTGIVKRKKRQFVSHLPQNFVPDRYQIEKHYKLLEDLRKEGYSLEKIELGGIVMMKEVADDS